MLSSIEELENSINSLLINSSNKTKSKQTKKFHSQTISNAVVLFSCSLCLIHSEVLFKKKIEIGIIFFPFVLSTPKSILFTQD